MCSIDLDPCEVWREEYRKARKQHTCAACCTVIKPGVKYLSHFSVYEGSPNTEALCLKCATDREKFVDEHEQSMTPSSFPPMLDECISDGDPDSRRWERMRKRLNERRHEARA